MGLKVFSSSSNLRPRVGVVGTSTGVVDAVEGISSQSSPPTFICFKKKGHKEISSSIDSNASAAEMGTGDDFRIAWTTSSVGRVRRLRGVAESEVVFVGEEKYLNED